VAESKNTKQTENTTPIPAELNPILTRKLIMAMHTAEIVYKRNDLIPHNYLVEIYNILTDMGIPGKGDAVD